MAKSIDELKTIADVVYEVVESSNLSCDDMAFVMNQVCNKLHPDWCMMPMYMIYGAMIGCEAKGFKMTINKKGGIDCSFIAGRGKYLDIRNPNEKGGEE